jgi:molybdopterin molybdotransferase
VTGPSRLVADEPLPFDEAERLVRGEVAALPCEDVPLDEAYGRVLGAPVRASHPLPPFANSAVDGWAVRSGDVASASDAAPVRLDVVGEATAGHAAGSRVGPGQAVRIMTGAPMPEGADALVMLEHSEWTARHVAVRRAAPPRRHVREAGEDVAAGTEVLPCGRELTPADVGLLAALGVPRARVHRRPAVAVLASGDELLEAHEPLAPGRIRSSNDRTLVGQARAAGALAARLDLVRDSIEDLVRRLEEARGADVLVTSGGVSVGDRDLLGAALQRAGFRKIFWRVRSSPGKPLLFGRLGDALVFGLPGNPVSAMVAFENFVRPSLRRLQGDPRPDRRRVVARAHAALEGPEDRRHFARVRLAWGPSGYVVREVGPAGSGNLSSMVAANGLAILPEGTRRIDAGQPVEVIVLAEPGAE